MNDSLGARSPSGVWIASDFRSNLIVDRYDPVFTKMRAQKLSHLRSENSEDAVTWNAFRTLRHINPREWIPMLWRLAFTHPAEPPSTDAVMQVWPRMSPPPALLASGDEGASEVDVLIEAPTWVWVLEAKLNSDISTGTTTRPTRDQILRNIDVGSYYSGVRDFYFSLLISSPVRSKVGVAKLEAYRELPTVRELLAPHRPDGLGNLRAVSLLRWSEIRSLLETLGDSASDEEERRYAQRAGMWLRSKGI